MSSTDRARYGRTAASIDLWWEEEISQLNERKTAISKEHDAWVRDHPEIKELLGDFMTRVLLEKPKDVRAFAAEHFAAFLKPDPAAAAAAPADDKK